jgi:hypothetical protein
MPTTDIGVLSDFVNTFQDEGFQTELQAELVDRLGAFSSGILTQTTVISAGESGNFVNITQWPTVSQEPEQILSGEDANIYSFADYKQRAAWVERVLAFGVENLVEIIAKKDPHGAVIDQAANIWSKAIQKSAISLIKGCMGVLAATHTTGGIYIGNKINLDAFRDAKQLLGDAQEQLVRALAHSKVLNDATGSILNAFPAVDSVSGQIINNGLKNNIYGTLAIMDDSVAAVGDVYSTYLAAPGSLGYKFDKWIRRDVNGNQVIANTVDFEFQRLPRTGGGQDVLYMRAKYLVHMFGMSYTSATANPTDAQLATDVNYTKVADDDRKIKVVELKTL